MTRTSPRDLERWIPRDLFSEYCGPRSERLLAYYDRRRDKQNPIGPSFNLLAFLLLPAWLGYRRQWTLWGSFVGLLALLPFLELGFGFRMPDGALLGTLFGLSLCGQGFLLSNANALYQSHRQRGTPDEAIRTDLRNRAAKSVPHAFAAGAGAAIALILSGILADLLLGPPTP